MVDTQALARLVGDVAGFLATSWGRLPVHVRAGERADADGGNPNLLDLGDVDQLIAATGLRAPAFRLVRDGQTLPQARVTRRARIGSRPVTDLVDVAAVHAAVADGATLVLQGLHRSFAPVAGFCRELEQTLTHPVQANAYLTPPVAQGLHLHGDPHDVFAVQTHGTKRWVVHPPDGADPWDLTLEPGDVLYLPAGIRHAAQTVGRPSLHLTIGVRSITWRQLIDRALSDVVAATDGLDRPLPVGWADQPEMLDTDLLSHLTAVAERLGEMSRDRSLVTEVVRARADAFRTAQPPDLTGGLQDLFELDRLDDTTALEIRPGAVWHVETMDRGVDLRLSDRRLRFPAALEPILRRIADARAVRPDELDDLIDQRSRLVLCARLVREGALTFARGDAAGQRGG